MRTVVAYSDGSGSKWWRFAIPFKWLNKTGDFHCYISNHSITEEELRRADVIVLHNIVDTEGLSTVLAAKEQWGKKVVVDVDDALFVTKNNPHAKAWEVLDASFVISQTIKEADLVTCSTEALKEELVKLNPNTVVLKNCFDPDWFNVKPVKNTDGTVRIGWAGGTSHYDDFVYIAPVIDHIMEKYPQVKMVICGDPRFRDLLKHKDRIELYHPVPIEMWPMRLASMALDIGIAPLADNEFNQYKSNIKYIEYSMCGIPSVTSSLVYGGQTTPIGWIQELSLLIESPDRRLAEANNATMKVQRKYNIADHYPLWAAVYK